MPRLKPNDIRLEKIKKQYLGKVLVFCEGKTEYNYIKYFADIINCYSKYTQVQVDLENVKGNARAVYNYAENYLKCEENKKQYKNYDKYLIFDCDAPENIGEVLKDIKESENDYIMLLTNIVFEVWLIMHEEVVGNVLTKCQIYSKMAKILDCQYYGDKEKASKGYIRRLIGNGTNVKRAIDNARKLEKEYIDIQGDIISNISRMNPYTQMHIFMEKILLEIGDATNKYKKSNVI